MNFRFQRGRREQTLTFPVLALILVCKIISWALQYPYLKINSDSLQQMVDTQWKWRKEDDGYSKLTQK
jgi:hypothetical protein